MCKLLIKFPTRQRPEKFFQVLNMYYENIADIENVHFLINCDSDDVTMNNKAVIDRLSTYKNLTLNFADNSTKIEAINHLPKQKIDFDILLLASDDMIPVKAGFDVIIIEEMKRFYPLFDGVLWFFDGFTKKLNTLPIVGIEYFKKFNYIYHSSYKSFWCDNEFMEVAQRLGKQKFIDLCIILHQHPLNSHYQKDSLYIKNDQFGYIDHQNYLKRKLINFGL